MSDFDHQKWSFWLVAGVFACILFMAMEFVTVCMVWQLQCDTKGKFLELITAILASALAYGAGRSSK